MFNIFYRSWIIGACAFFVFFVFWLVFLNVVVASWLQDAYRFVVGKNTELKLFLPEEPLLLVSIVVGFLVSVVVSIAVGLLTTRRGRAQFLAEKMVVDLYESREWFRNLYSHAPVAYIMLSGAGEIRQPNKAMLRFWGGVAEDLYNKPLTVLFSEEDSEEAKQYLESYKSGSPTVDREIRFVRKDGSIRWALFSVFAFNATVRSEQYGYATFIDITERKEIERAKTEFVSLASHQLRSPLATMKWYLEAILSETVKPTVEQQKNYIEKV